MNNDDKKLLKLAAKAVGIDLEFSDSGNPGYWHESLNHPQWIEWNPLFDDGDTLRLATKLRINIIQDDSCITAEWPDDKNSYSHHFLEEYFSYDDEEARKVSTRLAVVRAAAEIWRSMP